MLTDPTVAQRISQLGGAYSRVLTDPMLASAKGMQLLAQQAQQQATVLAYNDLFLLVAILCACALAALILHSIVKSLRPASAAQPA